LAPPAATNRNVTINAERIMLVLSRKKNESVVLGPPGQTLAVEVVVVEIRGDKVRLGIQVPRDWHLHRREVYEAVQSEAAGPKAEPE
jgi:carbon storage regulator